MSNAFEILRKAPLISYGGLQSKLLFVKVLASLTKEHCEAKRLLASSAFSSKSDISLPSKKAGGIIGILLLSKNLLGAVSGSSNFELNLARCLSFALTILCFRLLDEVTSLYDNLLD